MGFIKKAISGVTNLLGLTGDVPAGAQSKTGFFPPNIDINLPLFSAKQTARGDRITNTSQFSPEGLRIEDLLKDISGKKAAELAAFTEGGQDDIISREQRLFQEAADPGISTARNRLRDQVTAGTGGLFTTPGGQQAISGFEAEVSADKAGRNLQAIDRAELRRKVLEGEEISTLNSLVAFQNQPIAAANLALSTAKGATQGNIASAQALAQNEQANRDATSNFLSMIVGGFLGTSAGGGSTGAGFTQSPGTSFGSQAFGNTLFPSNQFATSSAFSVNTPSFSGFNPQGFNSPGASNAFFNPNTFQSLRR
tara:strand:- start:5 stop:934 length:930 start_codon:yes stop_codon:yes gene_type:complete